MQRREENNCPEYKESKDNIDGKKLAQNAMEYQEKVGGIQTGNSLKKRYLSFAFKIKL